MTRPSPLALTPTERQVRTAVTAAAVALFVVGALAGVWVESRRQR